MCGNVLDLKLVLESLHDILSLNLFHLLWCILLDKLIDVHVSSAHSHQDGIPLLYFDVNAFLSKLIHPLRLSQEHDVHFLRSNDIPNPRLWISNKNPELTVTERVRRRLETHNEAIKYNWPIWRGSQRLEATYNLLSKSH